MIKLLPKIFTSKMFAEWCMWYIALTFQAAFFSKSPFLLKVFVVVTCYLSIRETVKSVSNLKRITDRS